MICNIRRHLIAYTLAHPEAFGRCESCFRERHGISPKSAMARASGALHARAQAGSRKSSSAFELLAVQFQLRPVHLKQVLSFTIESCRVRYAVEMTGFGVVRPISRVGIFRPLSQLAAQLLPNAVSKAWHRRV